MKLRSEPPLSPREQNALMKQSIWIINAIEHGGVEPMMDYLEGYMTIKKQDGGPFIDDLDDKEKAKILGLMASLRLSGKVFLRDSSMYIQQVLSGINVKLVRVMDLSE